MHSFNTALALTLRIVPKGGDACVIRSGSIKRFDLHFSNYGWSGNLEFDVHDDAAVGGASVDKLLPHFTASALLRVELDVAAALSDTVDIRPAVTVKGIVTKRTWRELPVAQLPISKQVIARRYRIEVGDSASVLWKQHHPCRLYADKTMKQVIDDHETPLIRFGSKWTWVDKEPYKTPLVFFALDRSIGHASFYDFLMWYVDRHRLIWSYDCTKDEYAIVERKEDAADAAIKLLKIDFETLAEPVREATETYYGMYEPGITLDIPVVPRHAPQIMDSFTGAKVPGQKIANPRAEDNVGCDTLLRTPIADEVSERADFERQRLVTEPNPEVTAQFARFPAKPIFPGELVEFDTGAGDWSQDSWHGQKRSFRVFDVQMVGAAVNQGADDERQATTSRYLMSYRAQLELKSDLTTPRLPTFVEPTYPVHVEGKILSDIGDGTDATYEPKVEANGISEYRVEVPLWKDTATEIAAPYNPGNMPGQLFFPAYKGERVLLALTWRKAWIESFLDWRQQVSYPKDLQGNHMLLGKSPQSRTSLINYYENEGAVRPVFEIARSHQNDLQTIRISEGNLRIEVKEDVIDLPKVNNVDEAKQD